MSEYMAIISFEEEKHCMYCPFRDGEDDCMLQDIEIDDPINFDWEAQMEHCPLVPLVHGEWINPPTKDISVACICSACNWHGYMYETDVLGMPYCPNCGAKMKTKGEK